MGRTLGLTSPLTQGDDVKATQELLQGAADDMPYGAFYKGAIHGIYDEATAKAAHDAKYWLGFQLDDINDQAGDQLRGLLKTKPKDLPDGFEKRRSDRFTQKETPKPLRERVLMVAKTQVGTVEKPTNRTKYGVWYGMDGVPWCMIWVSWCGEQCDSTSFSKGSRYAFCPFVLADAKAKRNGLAIVAAKNVKPGDGVLFDWDNDGVADHVGICASTVAKNGDFDSYEGNAQTGNSGDQSNGGAVVFRTGKTARNTRDVIAFFSYS